MAAAGAAVTIAGLAACGPATHHHPLSSVTSNPVVHKDLTVLEHQAQTCAEHANFLTKHGRKNFYQCASAGTGKTPAQFEACAQRQLLKAGNVLTKKGRDAWVTGIGKNCVVTAK